MYRPVMTKLNERYNLIVKIPFEEFSKKFLLQGTAEYTLELVNKLCIINKLEGDKIKGILFSVRCYEYHDKEYQNSVILVTDLDYNYFSNEVDGLYLIDTVKEDDPELERLIGDENCILIYGNYDLAMKVGTSRLPQPFLASYK